MSAARKISDSERTAIMTDLVRQLYPSTGMTLATVVIEEVAPGTGFSGTSRWADMLALSVWPSKGLSLTGYEIKASRADLRKELRDLSKHEAVARYCTEWVLVAWDNHVLECGEKIPDHWGITITEQDADGERVLKSIRKPTTLTPVEWPRSFVCSMVRNAYQQSPSAHWTARAIQEAITRTREQTERLERSKTRGELYELTLPLLRALYGEDHWRKAKAPADLIEEAVARIAQINLGASPCGERV